MATTRELLFVTARYYKAGEHPWHDYMNRLDEEKGETV